MSRTKMYLLLAMLITSTAFGQKSNSVVRWYTVQEIDELREACRDRYIFGTTYFEFDSTGVLNGRPYREKEAIVAIEEMVRTYMLAGVTAKQIFEEDERRAKQRRHGVQRNKAQPQYENQTPVMKCTRCGQGRELHIPATITDVLNQCRGFSDTHRFCEQEGIR